MRPILTVGTALIMLLGMEGRALAQEKYCFGDLQGQLPSISVEQGHKFMARWGIVTQAMFYRSLFGLPGDSNDAVIQALTESFGCKMESDAGRLMQSRLIAGLAQVERGYIEGPHIQGHEDFYEELGQKVSEIPWPTGPAEISGFAFEEDIEFVKALHSARQFEDAFQQGGGGLR